MSQQQSVLYDAPGPRARRVTLIVSVLSALAAVTAGYFLVYRPLAEREQFTMEKWGPLIDPGNEVFGQVWTLLGEGVTATLTAAGLAIALSLLFGTALAVLRIQLKALLRRRFTGLATSFALALRALSWLLNLVTRFCVEVFRGLPVVITIFFVARGLPDLGLEIVLPFGHEMLPYLVLGLTIYNGVVIAEILRSGMEGLPSGQRESAAAIGLTSFQTTRMILLPQAFRIMLPALISQLIVVLKDTSLGFIIGYQETLLVGRTIIQNLRNPIQVYLVIGVLFIAVNYALSKLAESVQRRLAQGRRTSATPQPPAAPASTVAGQQTAAGTGGSATTGGTATSGSS
ncbi:MULTISPECIES: amino acid ABC transporter permease [unclassified Solwaraspora]|uniref:amino acid ABC transporter permease n=1 Tax=unclassified Solwaraspora TaxID=2627926 RepID=UPI00248B124E|nr:MULTISPECIES: amino acid ABC transporter permease [unclassified Solwaraspora]WBB98651.1 amino acid ABC transporter permease [Solwaraspora sp. WMMA2059]WBC22797.1 amino acid ABC transporter permease [Solwaraspora sp. WMMA2080]WFE19397.1 amino acid ABC transporter permease [Solwaraspora sp. WMMD937]WJK35162.1 amino acid ABC transporter permease [Solwaraspora sp. WMMA2065]